MAYKLHPSIHASVRYLRKDARFAKLIRKHGLPELTPGKDYFAALAESIIYQQVSGAAAATISRRFVALFKQGKKFPTPKQVSQMSIAKLRSAGLSGQKATYIKDLAAKFLDGTIDPRKLPHMSNQEIIEHLTQVKGIGEWTAHMFLIFTLNRPDVLPVGDLGIRKGFAQVYGMKSLPSPRTMERLAKLWREHATTACWYFWREADEAKD